MILMNQNQNMLRAYYQYNKSERTVADDINVKIFFDYKDTHFKIKFAWRPTPLFIDEMVLMFIEKYWYDTNTARNKAIEHAAVMFEAFTLKRVRQQNWWKLKSVNCFRVKVDQKMQIQKKRNEQI